MVSTAANFAAYVARRMGRRRRTGGNAEPKAAKS